MFTLKAINFSLSKNKMIAFWMLLLLLLLVAVVVGVTRMVVVVLVLAIMLRASRRTSQAEMEGKFSDSGNSSFYRNAVDH